MKLSWIEEGEVELDFDRISFERNDEFYCLIISNPVGVERERDRGQRMYLKRSFSSIIKDRC